MPAADRILLSVSIYIPLHSSALESSFPTHRGCRLLIIQCHSDGVMWEGLVPLLMDKQEQPISTNMNHIALKVLIHHFNDYILRIESNHTNCSDDGTDMENENQCNNCYWMTEPINMIVKDEHSNIASKQSTQQHLSVVILPPNPLYKCITYSRIPSSSPTSLFAGRLIYNENTLIRLTSLSAYISTMGGGFFLCRYLTTAVAMARQQCRIALIRGDEEMAFKCRINEGYCYIHAGKLNRGKKIIKFVLYDVAKRQKQKYGIDWKVSLEQHEESELAHTSDRELSELTVIRNMCTSALRFANLIKQQKKLEEEVARDESQDSLSATHDDFQRIRVVKNRIWKPCP
mmetsp:Transcript_29093/g.49615  ORF Transcript_29093/g.49615 Transcript_29093/m.49615 type:complete len:345 (+) Transcript_29093:139-1173(+)